VNLSSSSPISGCTNGTGTFTATGNTTATIPSSWRGSPPYGLSLYVTIAGVMPNAWDSTWPRRRVLPGRMKKRYPRGRVFLRGGCWGVFYRCC
jgi:hypothetical protein